MITTALTDYIILCHYNILLGHFPILRHTTMGKLGQIQYGPRRRSLLLAEADDAKASDGGLVVPCIYV